MDKKIFFIIFIIASVKLQANGEQANSIFDGLPKDSEIRAICNEEPIKDTCQQLANGIQRSQDCWVQHCQSGKDINQIDSQGVPDLYEYIYRLLPADEQLIQKEGQYIAELAVKPAVELINHNKRIKDIKECQDFWQQYDQLCNEHNEINVQEEPSFAQPAHQSVLVQDDEQLTKEKEPFLGEDDIKKSEHRYVCAAVGTFVVINLCCRYFANN